MSQIDTTNRRRDHRGQSMQAVLLVVLVVFLVQLWLITIALESYLAARTVAEAMPCRRSWRLAHVSRSTCGS